MARRHTPAPRPRRTVRAGRASRWVPKALAALAVLALLPAPAAARTASSDPAPPSVPAPRPSGSSQPAPSSSVPEKTRTVSAWLPYWDQENAYRSALAHAAQLRTVSPFWYETRSAGEVAGFPGAGDRTIIDGLRARGVQVVPTVMEQLPPGALAAVMTSPEQRAAHIDTLLTVVRSRAYDGLDIDYESIAPTPEATYPAVRDGFADFVTGLCARLHAVDKQCVVTVSPKTRTTGRIWDYKRLGAAADRLRVMAYNLHDAGGTPGPLSTPQWYDEILTRATAEVPLDKLEMGLPAYGWDWTRGRAGRAGHVTSRQAEALRREVGAAYTLDPESRTPHFTYTKDGEEHDVWYQDARGVAEHLPVLHRYGVRDTVLWALGFEEPALWRTLEES
ncbi:glycosyl hydrolase family 18 protein [Streptomyces sp. NPDC059524]|uniref:glycosyl hydrolase family 18 protein n=1 Tax=Streptomyces sp. NPDC059524 TaxID=3346856 RepID=UPI0036C3110B